MFNEERVDSIENVKRREEATRSPSGFEGFRERIVCTLVQLDDELNALVSKLRPVLRNVPAKEADKEALRKGSECEFENLMDSVEETIAEKAKILKSARERLVKRLTHGEIGQV